MKIEAPVKAILLQHWDPIGIADDPAAESEYDGYALQITGMLYNGATEEKVFEFLEKVSIENMGLKSNPEVSRSVAKRLFKLKLSKMK